MSTYKKLNYNLYYKGNPNPSDTNNIVVDGTIDVNNKIESISLVTLNNKKLIEYKAIKDVATDAYEFITHTDEIGEITRYSSKVEISTRPGATSAFFSLRANLLDEYYEGDPDPLYKTPPEDYLEWVCSTINDYFTSEGPNPDFPFSGPTFYFDCSSGKSAIIATYDNSSTSDYGKPKLVIIPDVEDTVSWEKTFEFGSTITVDDFYSVKKVTE